MPRSPKKLLLIEDDAQLADALQTYLSIKNYTTDIANTASQALGCLAQRNYDVVVLDLTLPDEDGLVLLRKVRHKVTAPIIITSGRNASSDRIAGLELGANDYLGKPFATRELELRLDHLVDSGQNHEQLASTQELEIGPFTLNMSLKALKTQTNNTISLTPSEFSILQFLGSHPDRVFSREQLIDEIGGLDGPENATAIDICICRLRKKIDLVPNQPSLITTVKGFGYCLSRQQ